MVERPDHALGPLRSCAIVSLPHTRDSLTLTLTTTSDLSDLYSTYLFFHGDLHSLNSHEDMAKTIAMEGQKWERSFYRRVDVEGYMYR